MAKDLVGSRIYVRLRISYKIITDPKEEVYDIPAFEILDLVQVEGLLKVKKQEIYLDAGPVFARVGRLGSGRF